MRLLNLDGNETWGQLTQAIRNLRHTQLHVGHASLLGRRIDVEVCELKVLRAVVGCDAPVNR